jgi:hypothetical protein
MVWYSETPTYDRRGHLRTLENIPENTKRTRITLDREKEFFIDNLLVRVLLIIEMILLDRPCAMGV